MAQPHITSYLYGSAGCTFADMGVGTVCDCMPASAFPEPVYIMPEIPQPGPRAIFGYISSCPGNAAAAHRNWRCSIRDPGR